jgi:hypothetical protein
MIPAMKRSVACVLAVLMVMLAVATASAQPGAQPPPPPPNWQPAPVPTLQPFKREKRYPLKIAAADAASVAAMLVGAVMLIDYEDGDGEVGFAFVIGGAIGIFVGSPLVHLSQDNGSSAWKALGLRVGIPAVMSILAQNSDADGGNDTLNGLTSLLFLGGVVIDYAVLAKVDVIEQGYAPYAMPLKDGGGVVGLGGTF